MYGASSQISLEANDKGIIEGSQTLQFKVLIPKRKSCKKREDCADDENIQALVAFFKLKDQGSNESTIYNLENGMLVEDALLHNSTMFPFAFPPSCFQIESFLQ